MSERYTAAELERMGRVAYAEARAGIACEPYDELPDWRRFRWRRAALAAVREAQAIDAERRDAWKAARRTTRRVTVNV